jgi:hypothetical protein
LAKKFCARYRFFRAGAFEVNFLCFTTSCPDAVHAASIAASTALVGVLITLLITSLNVWIAVRQGAMSHTRQREIVTLQKRLDIAADTQLKQLERLRDLQRAAERTEIQAVVVSKLQAGPGQIDADAFLGAAGTFMQEAAGIFAPPPSGAPNLPNAFSEPLKNVRKASVKITLLLEIAPSDRRPQIQQALADLSSTISHFRKLVEEAERGEHLDAS